MPNMESKAHGPDDPRLAVLATSPLPAWLWSADGTRVLWANPVGALVFGAANNTLLANKIFGPADPQRRQVMQLAHRLSPSGAIRLERLRGFGARLGTLITCACARLEVGDGSEGVLIAPAEPAGRSMPLTERLQRLVEDINAPVATFEADGTLVAASRNADLNGVRHLMEAGLEEARQIALKEGRAEAPFGPGHITLLRLGSRADLGLLALIAPAATIDTSIEEFGEQATSSEAVAEVGQMPNNAPENAPQGDASELVSPGAPTADPAPIEPTPPQPRQHPLRFMWQMDADGRFSLGSDAFTRLIGVNTAAGFGRPWPEVADVFGLDPEGLGVKAVATREAWSGIIVNWPADNGSCLPVELSGLPIHDGQRNFVGYRGFGVCRDLAGLTRLDALRSQEFFNDPPSADMMSPEIGRAVAGTWAAAAPPLHVPDPPVEVTAPASAASASSDTAQPTDLETPVETPSEIQEVPQPASPNVVPFRPLGEARPPVLTPVENSAFDALARQLSERLESENETDEAAEPACATQGVVAPPVEKETMEIAVKAPNWLAEPEPPARAESKRDKMLFDLLPTGVMVYRLDRLLYANQAFLERMGYPSLHALEQAGGVDALYVEPGVSSASSTSDTGTPVRISSPEAPSTGAIDARLHTINWDNDSALALIFAGAFAENAAPAPVVELPAPAAPEPSAVGHANAEELAAILDTTADGILMFDAQGNINSCNRS